MLLADSLALHHDSLPAIADAFHRHKESILAAVLDHLTDDAEFGDLKRDPAHARIMKETAKILIENLSVTMNYGIPDLMLDYLNWLRPFLLSRGFRPRALGRLLRAMHLAAVGYLPLDMTDGISHIIRALRTQAERQVEVSA